MKISTPHLFVRLAACMSVAVLAATGALVSPGMAKAATVPTHSYSALSCYEGTPIPSAGTQAYAMVTPISLQHQDGVGQYIINGNGTSSFGGHQWIDYRLWGYSYSKAKWFEGPLMRVEDGYPTNVPQRYVPSRGWIPSNQLAPLIPGPAQAYLSQVEGLTPGSGLWYFEVQTYWEPPLQNINPTMTGFYQPQAGGIYAYNTFSIDCTF